MEGRSGEVFFADRDKLRDDVRHRQLANAWAGACAKFWVAAFIMARLILPAESGCIWNCSPPGCAGHVPHFSRLSPWGSGRIDQLGLIFRSAGVRFEAAKLPSARSLAPLVNVKDDAEEHFGLLLLSSRFH